MNGSKRSEQCCSAATLTRVGVVIGSCDQVDAALSEVARVAPVGALSLMLVGVSSEPSPLWYMAALGAGLPAAHLLGQSGVDAAEAARVAALRAPTRARVVHRCAAGWRAPWLLDGLRRGIVDVLVLASVPHRRCDRRALEAALLEGAVTAVRAVAARPSAPARPPLPATARAAPVAVSPRVQVG